MLDAGANPNVSDQYGDKPLMMACKYSAGGAEEMVTYFLENPNHAKQKADPNAKNYQGETVLGKLLSLDPMYCYMVDKVTICRLLLQAGADPDGQTAYDGGDRRVSRTPLELAITIEYKIPSRAKQLVDLLLIEFKADPNCKALSGGATSLHFAAMYNLVEVVQELLKHGADVYAQDDYGDTPLHRAASGKVNVIPLLLAAGARLDLVNVRGASALRYAARWQKMDVVEQLLEAIKKQPIKTRLLLIENALEEDLWEQPKIKELLEGALADFRKEDFETNFSEKLSPTTQLQLISEYYEQASPAEQKKLETQVIKLVRDNVDQCSICKDEPINGKLALLADCGHCFHQDCIEPWLKRAGSCPLCRKPARIAVKFELPAPAEKKEAKMVEKEKKQPAPQRHSLSRRESLPAMPQQAPESRKSSASRPRTPSISRQRTPSLAEEKEPVGPAAMSDEDAQIMQQMIMSQIDTIIKPKASQVDNLTAAVGISISLMNHPLHAAIEQALAAKLAPLGLEGMYLALQLETVIKSFNTPQDLTDNRDLLYSKIDAYAAWAKRQNDKKYATQIESLKQKSLPDLKKFESRTITAEIRKQLEEKMV
jgi:ankyrin repeat protein